MDIFVQNYSSSSPIKVEFSTKNNSNCFEFEEVSLIFLIIIRASSLLVRDLRSETKGSRFESGCQTCRGMCRGELPAATLG